MTGEMDEIEQTLMELEGLKRSISSSYWRAVIEDAITRSSRSRNSNWRAL